jgi:hypothetical protein
VFLPADKLENGFLAVIGFCRLHRREIGVRNEIMHLGLLHNFEGFDESNAPISIFYEQLALNVTIATKR